MDNFHHTKIVPVIPQEEPEQTTLNPCLSKAQSVLKSLRKKNKGTRATMHLTNNKAMLPKKASRSPVKPRHNNRNQKRVVFSEKGNQSYESRAIVAEECPPLWHDYQDIAQFKQNTKYLHVQILQEHMQSSKSECGWTHSLSQVYRAFVQFRQSPDEMLAVLQATPHHFTEHGLGMETRSIPAVAMDTGMRKRELYACIKALQEQQPQLSDQARADYIQRACRSWTLPSKLYARHVAELVRISEKR